MKQGDVIRSGGFEAVPHLLGLGCVIWGREKAVAGSFVRSAVSLGQRGGVGRQAGVQAATAPPPPGAAERPLMPTPGGGGSRLGRGLLWGRGREPPARRRRGGGGGRGDEALPHPAPPRGGGGHGAAGPNPGQEVGARPSRLPQLLPQLLLPLPTPRPRASSYSASKRQQPRPERGQLRPCVMPPCVLWSRPQRREAWAALAGSPPLSCCLTAVSGCVSFCFSLCWFGT